MNPLTEQQIDAEVSRYEPHKVGCRDYWFWRYAIPTKHDVPQRIWDSMQGDVVMECECRRYPTREAAIADLRQALLQTGESENQP